MWEPIKTLNDVQWRKHNKYSRIPELYWKWYCTRMFSDLLTLVSRGLPSATIEASRLFCWTSLWNGPCISNKAVGHDCLSKMHQNQSKRWRNNKFSKHLRVFQTSSLSILKARTREWHFTQDFWFINCGHLSCFTMDFISQSIEAAAIKVTNPRAEAYPQSISSNISACHAMKQYVSSPTASCFKKFRKYACLTKISIQKNCWKIFLNHQLELSLA